MYASAMRLVVLKFLLSWAVRYPTCFTPELNAMVLAVQFTK